MTAAKVTLSGRVFNKNNIWQPIALPFALSADQIAAGPLAGCELKQLDTQLSYNDTETNTLHLSFKDTTAITAGKPYLIRWAEGDPILSPVFTNVTLTNKTVLYFNENGQLVNPDGFESHNDIEEITNYELRPKSSATVCSSLSATAASMMPKEIR